MLCLKEGAKKNICTNILIYYDCFVDPPLFCHLAFALHQQVQVSTLGLVFILLTFEVLFHPCYFNVTYN